MKSKLYSRAAMEAELLVAWTRDTRVLTLQYLRLLIEIDNLEEKLDSADCPVTVRGIRRRIADLKEVCAAFQDVLSSCGRTGADGSTPG